MEGDVRDKLYNQGATVLVCTSFHQLAIRSAESSTDLISLDFQNSINRFDFFGFPKFCRWNMLNRISQK